MMLTKTKITPVTIVLFALFSLALMACGGGGDDAAAPSPSPSLQVLPANFDFGSVTDANTASPLEVTIRNAGNANLNVSDIQLSDATNFSLDINGGTCASSAPTIAAGASCTVIVDFTPPPPPAFATYSADLTIRSNDPTTPVFDLALLGTLEDINAISVKINQIEACPRPGLATVYVSVNDQGGFPVTGLNPADFLITEARAGGATATPTTAVSVDDTVTLSVALLMDYSGSIRMEPDNVTDMENAAISFVNQLGANDEAEIIKYATTIQVTQAFTSNQASLVSAIQSTPNIGSSTALYDAIVLATDNLSTRTKDRRAIIVITDGMDRDGSGGQLSDNGISDVIADANSRGVPVFTVGLGGAVDVSVLQQIADDTGGTFSDSTTSDNLATIYQQLADLLFTDQYILTYTTALLANATDDLTVTATYAPGVTGSDTKTIIVCP